MKTYINFIILIFLFSCDGENANDCFQKAGKMIKEEVSVDSFDKILVNRDIELIIKQGNDQKVEILTGENLFNDIEAKVVEGRLILTDNNTCNFVRDYGITKIYVTNPNITEIRSSTQYDVRSEGVLTFPNLVLFSEDFNAPDTFTVGNFVLNVNNNELRIVFNSLSNAFISGSTDAFYVGLFAGASRIEAGQFLANTVEISHRSSNDVIVNPQQSLTGIIRGTGNVISKNRPPIVEVEEVYKGRLIFE